MLDGVPGMDWFDRVRFELATSLESSADYWTDCPVGEKRPHDLLALVSQISWVRGEKKSDDWFEHDCVIYGVMADLLTDIDEPVHAEALRMASRATIPKPKMIWHK